jgi:hypothetical protein
MSFVSWNAQIEVRLRKGQHIFLCLLLVDVKNGSIHLAEREWDSVRAPARE